jgi:hypothetical protein
MVYGLGTLGLLLPSRPIARRKPVVLAAFFCFVNLASLKAAWNLLTGRRIVHWEPQRNGEGAAADAETEPSGQAAAR